MFGRALRLLIANWRIVVPGLAIGVVSGALSWILEPPLDASDIREYASNAAIALVQLVATLLSITYTTGMAQAAWQRGCSTFADGAHAFRRDAVHVFAALFWLFVGGVIASLGAPYTFGLSLGAYVYFGIYAMPSAVVGERSGLSAVIESTEIAFRRALPTLLMVFVLALIVFVTSALAQWVSETPLVGPLLSALAVQTVIAYFTLVVTGEYIALRRAPESGSVVG
jgi:hypothetical protein